MKFARQEDIALLFMAELAASFGHGPVSVSSVAKTHGISAPILKKIVRRLKKAGLVDSREGVTGGYSLIRDPHAITVLSVMDVFSGSDQTVMRFKKFPAGCPLTRRCLPQVIRRMVTDAVARSLSRVTLSDIISGRLS